MANLDIQKFRTDAQAFLSRSDKEYYLHFSGRKDSLETASIFDKYSWLFTVSNMQYLQQKKQQEAGQSRKKYSYLLKFCTEYLLEKSLQQLRQQIALDEAAARVNIDGKDMPFRFLEVMLANEPDKARRDHIEKLRNDKIEEALNPNLYQYWEEVHQQARQFGFDSYSHLFSYLLEQDFDLLQAGMKKLLSETHQLYQNHFGQLLYQELGINLGQSARSDFIYLKRGQKYDPYFSTHKMIGLFSETLKQLGIDIYSQKNIIFDIEKRKNKSPRAFCCTVRIPDEIYLVVMPSGGQDDYEAMFHEGGHAQHFAHTSENLDFEYKFLGDNAVTEGYAFLLESLLQNRYWLADFAGMGDQTAKQFSYYSNLLKLWYCRRYAGKLEYELLLHDGSPIQGRQQQYSHILGEACGMDYHPSSYLTDVDTGFYCTNYIRAWAFQAQLGHYLVTKFGNKWFKSNKAGNFLKEVWGSGQKYDADQVLGQLGLGRLDLDYLIGSLVDSINQYEEL